MGGIPIPCGSLLPCSARIHSIYTCKRIIPLHSYWEAQRHGFPGDGSMHSARMIRALRTLRIVFAACVPVLVLYLLSAACSRVGPSHDELWNLYSSPLIGLAGATWIKTSLDLFGIHIVLLSGPYHGAIKTTLFTPLLELTRNIEVIRLANCLLLLTFITIYLWGSRRIAVSSRLNAFYAAICIFLVPPLYINAPFDNGQFIVPSLLFAIGLAATMRALSSGTPIYYWVAYTAGCLCMYEKLTELNFAIPVCACSLYFLIRRRLGFKTVAAAVLLPVVIFSPYLIYFLFEGGWSELMTVSASAKTTYATKLSIMIDYMPNNVFATGKSHTLTSLFGDSPTFAAASFVVICATLLCIIALFYQIVRYGRKGFAGAIAAQTYLWLVFIGAILLQSAVNGLNRPWHFSSYWIVLIFIIGLGVQQLAGHSRRLAAAALTVAGLLCAFSFAQTLSFVRNHSPIGIASTGILKVATFLKNYHKGLDLVCVDYSVCSPLAFLVGDDAKVKADYAFSPRHHGLPALVDAAMDGDNAVLILRRVQTREDPAYVHFLDDGSKLFFEHGDIQRYTLLRSFNDDLGTTFFIYRK